MRRSGHLLPALRKDNAPTMHAFADMHIIHDHCIHADQALCAQMSPVDDGSVAYMGTFFEAHGRSRETCGPRNFLERCSHRQLQSFPNLHEEQHRRQ